LNEEQYRQVCEACDSVLLSPDAHLETAAIPWLHVIREHPSFLKDYEDLFDKPGQTSSKRRLRFGLGWVRQLWRGVWSSGQAWFGQKEFQQPAEILFVSHLLNRSQAGSATDFYFGDLPERIHAAGHRVVVALVDHTGNADERLVKSWDSSPIPHVILSNSMDFREEWSLYRRLKKESTRLAENSRSSASGLLNRVLARASVEALSGGARTTLRMYRQINELVAQVRPRVMVVTYEGHAWERIAFAAAREAQPSVTCIGYQHAAIFRLQHSARRNLQSRFNPDQLFAAGQVSKRQLQNSPRLGDLQVKVLGSHRSGSGPKIALEQPFITCLVLPEGIVSECHLLFEFSISCAKLRPDVHFVWRLHPLVKFESLIANHPAFKILPKNVELSAVPIEDDLARASHALYRGSTAVVKAVCANVQPIYLELPGEMTVDPLYQLGDWRKRVISPERFSSIVGQPPLRAAASEDQLAAVRYCDDFYEPIDASVVLDNLQPRSRV
jgi:hypothetical protein